MLIDIIINLKDDNRQLKTELEVCQHLFNNVEAELSRPKKETEQSAKELEETKDVKKSTLDAKVVHLQEALIEEGKKLCKGSLQLNSKKNA